MILVRLGRSADQVHIILESIRAAATAATADELPPEVLAHLTEEELQHLNVKLAVPPEVSSMEVTPAPQKAPAEVHSDAGLPASSSGAVHGVHKSPEAHEWRQIHCDVCSMFIARVKTNPNHPAGMREEARMALLDGTFPHQGVLATSRLHSTWKGQQRALDELTKWAVKLHKGPNDHPVTHCTM